MDKDTINSLVSEVQHIAENAGNLIMTFFDELAEEEIEFKADQSPVTIADKAANKQIVDELINLDDTIPIISEEGLAQNLDNTDTFWLVDPLDGTKEFINGSQEFTVNIALIDRGEPVLGVIHQPPTSITTFGSKESGAFIAGDDEKLSTNSPDKSCMLAVSKRHSSGEETKFALFLQDKFDEMRTIGLGSSLKLNAIAQGSAHIYSRFGRTFQWDIAAGHSILRSAGGEVVDLQGKPISYKNDSNQPINGFFAVSDLAYWNGIINEFNNL